MSREKDIEEGMVPLGTNIGGDTADDFDDVEGGTTQIDGADDVTNYSELMLLYHHLHSTTPNILMLGTLALLLRHLLPQPLPVVQR